MTDKDVYKRQVFECSADSNLQSFDEWIFNLFHYTPLNLYVIGL